MHRFVAVYEGATVSSARLLAVSAEPRLVARFFEELMGEITVEEQDTNPGNGRVLELARGARGGEGRDE